MSAPILLEDRSVVAVVGPEARQFLQGLITNDIEKVSPASAIYAALLTPQGKILFDFLIAEGDGALLFDCHRDSRDALVKRLTMYRLRSKVQIEPREQLSVLAGLHGRPAERGITFADPRLPALGHRTIGAAAEMPATIANASAYHEHRLALGVPESADFGSDRMFALDADLDELHAIDFEKGCYVGQELTARMKHRGTARKRLLPILSTDGSNVPPRDTSVTAKGHAVGEIVSTYDARGFALIRLDRLEDAGDAALRAGDAQVTISKPAWLFS
jgi:folate-binding protein YgfZ